MPDVTADVIRAIANANKPPVVFTRGGALTRIRTNDDGTLAVQQMTEANIRGHAARCANFLAITVEGDEVATAPPLDVIRDVPTVDLAKHTREHGLPEIPPIEAIVTSPVLRPDWSVLDQHGYDLATRLFYNRSPDLNVPAVSDNPTASDVRRAVGLINEAIGDFPHETDADYANAVGTLITPFIRHSIEGKVPIAGMDAPQAGTGKSLHTEVISMIATGSNQCATVQADTGRSRSWPSTASSGRGI
jgi:hypothetical protein